ncbi:hypothetical protein TNCV_240421 [Trichonephila clavipes]|nr:hypothetical protein TNCV_240421 [Trichonephila clavipes]
MSLGWLCPPRVCSWVKGEIIILCYYSLSNRVVKENDIRSLNRSELTPLDVHRASTSSNTMAIGDRLHSFEQRSSEEDDS